MQTPPLNLLTWLLALLPIAVVLVLMVGFRWGGRKAGPVGWAVAMLVAWLYFGAGPEVLLTSQLRGILFTLDPLYIIWMALVLYRVVDEAGAIAIVGQGIVRLTVDPTMQLLLLAWGFSSFLQGVAGFGVPIAVVAPLLIGLGFAPVVAVAAAAIGHSWAVTFGSMASSFQMLMAVTELPGEVLAPWSSFFLGVVCFGCGIAAAWAYQRGSALRKGWPALLLMGTVMAGVQAGLAMSGLWNLAGFGAGLAGLTVGALVARLPRYQRFGQSAPDAGVATEEPSVGTGPARRTPLPLWLALAPYLVLIVVVTAAELWPWLNATLDQIKIEVLFAKVQTSYGWTTKEGPGRIISVFGHAGALLAYVSLIFFVVYGWAGYYTAGTGRRIVQRTIKSALPSSIGIATMVGMAMVMDHAGMTYVLATGLGKVAGSLYPLAAPFIGVLGAFMTGSNTNSNAVFATLQKQAAELLGMSVVVILAAQTAGGAMGSMFAPAKLIVGCSTAGLEGQEGKVLKKVLAPGLIIAGVVGVLAWLVIALGLGGS